VRIGVISVPRTSLWSILVVTERLPATMDCILMKTLHAAFTISFPIISAIGKVLFTLPALSIGKLEMWANAQRDGRPAKYRWHPLFNAAKFG